MGASLPPETLQLQKELESLLITLKNNRDKVPLDVLKSRYKSGYESLCQNISKTSSDYVKQVLFHGLRIHKDYQNEILPVIRRVIQESGLLKKLSTAAFHKQDLSEFVALTFQLKDKIVDTLDSFYGIHTGLYLTPECLEFADAFPEFYCFANGCIWHDGQWIPLEYIHPEAVQIQNKAPG